MNFHCTRGEGKPLRCTYVKGACLFGNLTDALPVPCTRVHTFAYMLCHWWIDGCMHNWCVYVVSARARVCVYICVYTRPSRCMLDCLKAELARIFIGHLRRFFESKAINLFEIGVSDYTDKRLFLGISINFLKLFTLILFHNQIFIFQDSKRIFAHFLLSYCESIYAQDSNYLLLIRYNNNII